VKQNAWDIQKGSGKVGTGHWRYWDIPYDFIVETALKWKMQMDGIKKPWLCWNMNDKWCLLQQKLVLEVGWTPVVGWDPNLGVGCPPLVEGAIAIDFNRDLQLPVFYQHIPLEFAFLWADKLATWHSDLLLPRKKMKHAAHIFEQLQDGEMAAVKTYGGMRNFFNKKYHRFWEVLACTTRRASEDQFLKGCGWWRGFQSHPNADKSPAEIERRNKFYDDHGCGIEYWRRYYGGQIKVIPERWISKEHFSIISVKDYKKGASKSEELDINFDLNKITNSLNISDLLNNKDVKINYR
jgi:hypothetical protein